MVPTDSDRNFCPGDLCVCQPQGGKKQRCQTVYCCLQATVCVQLCLFTASLTDNIKSGLFHLAFLTWEDLSLTWVSTYKQCKPHWLGAYLFPPCESPGQSWTSGCWPSPPGQTSSFHQSPHLRCRRHGNVAGYRPAREGEGRVDGWKYHKRHG